MATYLIEFRVSGPASKYAKGLIFDIARKFRVRGMVQHRPVPHTTLYGPFTTTNQQRMISEVIRVCNKYHGVDYTCTGFNFFEDPKKVVYLELEPSQELRNLRHDLASTLLPITDTISDQDRKGKNAFAFHSTLAYKDIDNKFNQIWKYVQSKERPRIHQYVLRVTILYGGKILHEYDFFQKRLLNRYEALNRNEYLRTIELLRAAYGTEKQFIPAQIEEPVRRSPARRKPSLWHRFKKWLGI